MTRLCRLAAWLLLGMGTAAVHGDGGTILLHQDAGPFSVTLFATPQPLHTGPADMSVMVQDRSSGDVLLDPVIDLTLTPAARDATQQTVRLARGQASNRLLQAAAVQFSKPGKWIGTLSIRRGAEKAQVRTEFSVEPDTSRARLVWFYLLLPVGIIILFAIHQGLKFRREAR